MNRGFWIGESTPDAAAAECGNGMRRCPAVAESECFQKLNDGQLPPPMETRDDKVEANTVLPSRVEGDSGDMPDHLHRRLSVQAHNGASAS